MSQAEKICKVLIARGKWSKNNCPICRIINKSTCPILTEMRERELADKNEEYFLATSNQYHPAHPDNQ